MKLHYADPPYLGCGKLYAEHHPQALDWDDPQTHVRLVEQLQDESDGWVLQNLLSGRRTAMVAPIS